MWYYIAHLHQWSKPDRAMNKKRKLKMQKINKLNCFKKRKQKSTNQSTKATYLLQKWGHACNFPMHVTTISSLTPPSCMADHFHMQSYKPTTIPPSPLPPYMCKSVDRPELLQALKHGRPSTLFLADRQGGVARGDVRRHLTSTTSASPPSSPKPEARRRRTKTSAPSSCSSFWRTPPTPGRRCTSSWPRPRARRWRRRCRGATISTPPWSGGSRRWRPVSKS